MQSQSITINIPRGNNIGLAIQKELQKDLLCNRIKYIYVEIHRDTVNKCNVATVDYTYKEQNNNLKAKIR